MRKRRTRRAARLYKLYATFFDKAEQERRWNPYRDVPWDRINANVSEPAIWDSSQGAILGRALWDTSGPSAEARALAISRQSRPYAHVRMRSR